MVQNELCSGCRTCEAVCSLSHEGVVSSQLSRIEVATWPFKGYQSMVYVCQQCQDPQCVYVYPTGALYVDEKTGARNIEANTCNGCKLCLEACTTLPPGIRYDATKNVCFKCDLCGGEPLCVKYCMEEALSFKLE